WYAIDDNRPPSSVVGVGNDAWSLGTQVTVPLWASKYDAIENEAAWRHMSTHANATALRTELAAEVTAELEQLRSSERTARLYRDSLLPEARNTLDIDQSKLAEGQAMIETVIDDVNDVLEMELAYAQTLADAEMARARLARLTGEGRTDLPDAR
ncbi:MAG: TolC family protein, partial [Planctomycetales bacterium]|nr:TolC family protein [Planctomycetales bacterium]